MVQALYITSFINFSRRKTNFNRKVEVIWAKWHVSLQFFSSFERRLSAFEALAALSLPVLLDAKHFPQAQSSFFFLTTYSFNCSLKVRHTGVYFYWFSYL